MSVKMYNEDYINETAKAIQKLTGRTEKMKVSEFADVLNTYMEPDDLTNVHKVKIIITELTVDMWTQLNEISFENVLTGEVYQYSASDTITIPSGLQPSQDIRRLISNTINDPVHFWTRPLPLPCPIEITFPSGIDLTYYNVLHIYGGSTGTIEGYGANIKRINVDVQTGTSDYYTRLINNKVLNWKYVYNTFDNGANQVYLNLGHKKYRYIRFLIHSTIDGSTVSSGNIILGGYLGFYNTNDQYAYSALATATSNTREAYFPVSNIMDPTKQWTSDMFIKGTPDGSTEEVYIQIDTSSMLDLNVYNYVDFVKSVNNDSNYVRCPGVVSMMFTNDPYFINFDRYVTREQFNIYADPATVCFTKQLV